MFVWHVAALELHSYGSLWKSETIEDHVLYHGTVVSKCTSKATRLPATVLRDVLWVTALSKTYSRLCIHLTDSPVEYNVQTPRFIGFEYICATYNHGMAQDIYDLQSCGACSTTRIKLAGRTAPCKHTSAEEHPTQKKIEP